jgi:tRNA nucleotidyltransferase (CCA-adding enzyme)
MAETGLLEEILPIFIPMIGCAQNKYHSFDVWGHTLATIDSLPNTDPILRLAGLFHDIGKPWVKGTHPVTGESTFYGHEDLGAGMARLILTGLKFSNEDLDRITHLVRHHLIRYGREWSNATIRRWVRTVGSKNVADLCILARADTAGKGPAKVALDVKLIDDLEDRVQNLSLTEVIPESTKILAINGHDVMQLLGIPPGPKVGKILNSMLEAVIDDPNLNNRKSLLRLVEVIYTQ